MVSRKAVVLLFWTKARAFLFGQKSINRYISLSSSKEESTSFELAGLWRLTRCELDDGFKDPMLKNSFYKQGPHSVSWSGDVWTSKKRATSPLVSKVVINLNRKGTFSTLPEAKEKIRGVWSVKGRELSLVRFSKFGSNVEEWYSGKLARNGSSAGGTMAYGNSEPEYSGTFSMKRAMPQLDPVKMIQTPKKSALSFNTSQLIGKWSLEFSTSTSFSVFVLELKSDLTWTSVSGVASTSSSRTDEQPRLAGKWNIFDENIDLTSGIPGAGSKLFIWLRRFGSTKAKSVSKGVSITHDQLYMGKIFPAPSSLQDEPSKKNNAISLTPVVKDVQGSVAVGWSTEPVFIGRFTLKRWYGQESA